MLKKGIIFLQLIIATKIFAGSNINTDPLAKLRDIHLPKAIGWWPLAPGWYALIVLIILLMVAIILFTYKYYLRQKTKRNALNLLHHYKKQYQNIGDSHLQAANISELLKRVALQYYPREKVAALKGDDWIVFLNTTSKNLDFNQVKAELITAPYQASQEYNLDKLFALSQKWIMQRSGRCLN